MHKQPQANSRSQPTARVANQNRRRREVVPVDKAARSGTQPTESGSTYSEHSGDRKLDTEPDTDENDNADDTRSITGHQSRAGEK